MQVSSCNYVKNEALVQVFSCEFREIFKNTIFTEHLWATVSGYILLAIYYANIIPA